MNKELITTLLLNLKRKSLKTKSHFWIQLCTKGKGKGLMKDETLRLLTNFSKKKMFKKYKKNFKSILTRKRSTGFNISKPLWNTLWKQERGTKTFKRKIILSFVTQYQPSVPNLTHILMKHWQMIENQPFLRQIYKEPPCNYIIQMRTVSKGYTSNSLTMRKA